MLRVVIGPPAAGKSTWVRQNAKPGDIVIDFDVLAIALTHGHNGSHHHTAETKAVAKAARQAAIDTALTLTDRDVFIIHATPSFQLLDSYRQLGAKIVTVDPGEEIVLARAKAERPWQMQQVVKRWYHPDAPPVPSLSESRPVAKPASRTVSPRKRGLDAAHDAQRKRLLAALIDGSRCWWCGLALFRDPGRNPDRAPLEADHSVPRSKGGKIADRLLHRTCNRSRGDGSRDHLRPAVANASPPENLSTRDWLS